MWDQAGASPAVLPDLRPYLPLVDQMVDGALVVDRTGRTVKANAAAAAIFGVAPERLLVPIDHIVERFDLRALETDEQALPVGRRALAGEVATPVERLVQTPAGTRKRLRLGEVPLRDPGGSVIGALVLLTEITSDRAEEERRQATDEQLARETILKQAAEIAHMGAWWIDLLDPDDVDANPLHWSDEVYRIFGYEPGTVEVTNQLFFECVPPEDHASIREAVALALAERRPYTCEHRVIRPDGCRRIVLERADVVVDEHDRPVRLIGAIHDVTERRLTDEAMQETEERFRIMADSAPVMIWVTNAEGGVQFVNRTYRTFFGVGCEEAAVTWQPLVHSDDSAYVEGFRRAVRDHAPFLAEGRVQRFDGEWRWVESYGEPRFSPRGEFLGHVGISPDITERKRMEQQLREADRRKDEFLGMLSHELRNPLAPIRNSVYIMKHADATGAQARRARAVIERQVDHLTQLVDDLLDVTRIAGGKIELRRERVDLAVIVRGAGEDFRSVMDEHGLRFVLEVPGTSVWADADGTRIVQVVGNLLQNAAKFTPRGGRVTLTLSSTGDRAEIRVRDTGVGIDPDLLPRLFEPFVQAERSLARTQGGLGLGLALVRGISELHGGTVRVESDGPGQGTQFVIHLPLA